jgi:hypothetical protein
MASPPAYAIAPGSPFTAIGARLTFQFLRNARKVRATRSLPATALRGAPPMPPVSVQPTTAGSSTSSSAFRSPLQEAV